MRSSPLRVCPRCPVLTAVVESTFTPAPARCTEMSDGPVRSADSEGALISQAKMGNGEAFAKLIHRRRRKLFQLALTITHNHEDAEDVLQEAMIKAYANLETFEGRAQFSTWLTRITINEALMKLRKRETQKYVSIDEFVDSEDGTPIPRQFEDHREDPDRLFAQQRLHETLSKAIKGLRPHSHDVFVLRELEQVSTVEAARLLSLSVTTVKTRLRRARMELRQHLASYAEASAC